MCKRWLGLPVLHKKVGTFEFVVYWLPVLHYLLQMYFCSSQSLCVSVSRYLCLCVCIHIYMIYVYMYISGTLTFTL